MFTSWGRETTNKYTADEIKSILDGFADKDKYGTVLRAKGIVEGENGEWIHFDYVPGESDVRTGKAGVIGRICVIGAELNETEAAKAFKVD